MKTFLLLLSIIVIVQSTLAQDTGVATKKCEDFLPAKTCDNLRKVAAFLHEKASTVSDAVKAAIAKHKTKTAEILAFIKEYIAENLNCNATLPDDICTKLSELGKNAKLTALQIKLAIENAVANGATTATDIYNKAVDFMKTYVSCTAFFGQTACTNLKLAVQKFGEQTQLLKEAIFAAAQKHYKTVTELLNAVTNTIIDAAKNFTCETVLPQATCAKIRSIATTLHLTTKQVREAIERAIVDGAKTAKDIFNKTITFLTTKINCENILSKTTCDNFLEAIQKLHEQRILIQEAIMSAVLHQITTTAGIIKNIKDTLVEKAVNFKCTDILPEKQCAFIKYVATRFKIRAADLHKTLVEVIVNGTITAKQIYDKTLGALVEEAKNIQCEDLIDSNICGKLKSIATNLHIKMSQVTLAVMEAIVAGKDTVKQIFIFAKEFLIDKLSCNNFLSESTCDRIEDLAAMLHIKFQEVINKIKEWYTNGVVKVSQIPKKIISWIWDKFLGNVYKRSADETKSEVRTKVKEILEKIFKNLEEFKKKIAELFGKDTSMVKRDIIDDMKNALKTAKGFAKQLLESLLTKSKAELEKLKEFIKTIINDTGAVNKQMDVTYKIIEDIAKREISQYFSY